MIQGVLFDMDGLRKESDTKAGNMQEKSLAFI